MSRVWAPNQLEKKCLEHLDAPGSWSILKRERPDEDNVLPWSPFGRIFVFNFVLFGAILTALFFVLEGTSGMTAADIKDDLPYGLGAVALVATALGIYVTHLYRRSWNGRARSILRYHEETRSA